jgi:hypothetical protein
VLPHEDLDVEVEYDCCVSAQYRIASATVSGSHIEIQLRAKHTDCLAKEKCGIDGEGCGASVADRANTEGAAAACC